jgi:RNA polymerase sigma factor (sigma-70 family)
MKTGQSTPNWQLDRLFRVGTIGGMTDPELLEQFLGGPDEAAELAFEALVKRHGPMVFRVCRSVLRDTHAAEDAFQATFLVLARKARTLGSRELLGNWLYGVAFRTARKAKVLAIRRRAFELQAGMGKPAAIGQLHSDCGLDDLEQVLHQEIDRLPASYRAAVVVCYLKGMTQAQAAQELRLAESTIRGRLARARKLLGQRLVRRGIALSAGLAALDAPVEADFLNVISAQSRSIACAALQFGKLGQRALGAVSATAQGIAQGVLKTMWLNSLKTIAALAIAAIFLTAGTASLLPRRAAANPQIGAPPLGIAPDALAPALVSKVAAELEPAPSPDPPPQKDAQTSKVRSAKGKARRQAQQAAVDPDLAKVAPGPIDRALPLSKDCLILAYLPNQNLGGVDMLGLANYDGGCRCLLGWPDIPSDEAASADRRFFVALYSRKTTSHPPAGPIHAFELVEGWNEFSSWKLQPKYNPEPAVTYKFEPGDGWKLFEVTSLLREQAKAGRSGHGILLRFLSEDFSTARENWSGYDFVTREGAGDWVSRRPVLLMVKAGAQKRQ